MVDKKTTVGIDVGEQLGEAISKLNETIDVLSTLARLEEKVLPFIALLTKINHSLRELQQSTTAKG